MNKKPDNLVYVIVVVALIVVAVVTTAIIGAVKNSSSAPTDIRARAGVTNVVKLTGTVASVDSATGIITVSGVQLAPESRSGPAANYGTWAVTPPVSFSLATAVPGSSISFTVEGSTFNVVAHKVTASQMTVSR